ncbi:hypothetical protein HQQ92_09555 [Shewanella sp. DC2-4]|uniref:hypothetical protein n=1 Tax=Shewanella sp. DC2-4 TaxID=2739431 RepID=UPI001563F459|nr:hypothetical protein [Shewanella sp. DC2-4]NRD32012.1 hypothetical protein [Shewanella sp. DC2-4]
MPSALDRALFARLFSPPDSFSLAADLQRVYRQTVEDKTNLQHSKVQYCNTALLYHWWYFFEGD